MEEKKNNENESSALDEKSLEAEQQEKKELFDIKAEIISWIKVVVCALVLAFILGNYVLMNAYIPSGSMKNTLNEKDRVIGFRLSYVFSEPKRYDVVMFKYPDDESKDFIKRVIGLPGETVTIKNGEVYINDSKKPLEEPYLRETPNANNDGVFVVPEGCYFMLGDNRNASNDSRRWVNKYVKKKKILAKALFRFYPDPTWIKTDY